MCVTEACQPHSASLHVEPEEDDFRTNIEGVYLGESGLSSGVTSCSHRFK